MIVEYVEPPGAIDGGMVAPTVPQALEFFSKYRRRAQ